MPATHKPFIQTTGVVARSESARRVLRCSGPSRVVFLWTAVIGPERQLCLTQGRPMLELLFESPKIVGTHARQHPVSPEWTKTVMLGLRVESRPSEFPKMGSHNDVRSPVSRSFPVQLNQPQSGSR